jgi:hypothetical protein
VLNDHDGRAHVVRVEAAGAVGQRLEPGDDRGQASANFRVSHGKWSCFVTGPACEGKQKDAPKRTGPLFGASVKDASSCLRSAA